MTEYQSLQSAFPGAFGPYRQKTALDVFVYGGLIAPQALKFYPVAACSGTHQSLCLLYGVSTGKEQVIQKLLIHLYHQLRKTRAFRSKSDSLATLSLCLCRWHRSKQSCSFKGQGMTGLDRAIRQEELEYLSVLQNDRDEYSD